MDGIDWKADSPDQLYTLLDGDLERGMFGAVCEAARALTTHTPQEEKLKLLDKLLDYRKNKCGLDQYDWFNSDLTKFAIEVLAGEEEYTILNFIIESEPESDRNKSINHFHELIIHCLNKKFEYLSLQSPDDAKELIKWLRDLDAQITSRVNTSGLQEKIEKFIQNFD